MRLTTFIVNSDAASTVQSTLRSCQKYKTDAEPIASNCHHHHDQPGKTRSKTKSKTFRRDGGNENPHDRRREYRLSLSDETSTAEIAYSNPACAEVDNRSEWNAVSPDEHIIFDLEGGILVTRTDNPTRTRIDIKRAKSPRNGIRQFSFNRVGSASDMYSSLRKKLSRRKLKNKKSQKKKRVRFVDEMEAITAISLSNVSATNTTLPLCSYFGDDNRPFPIDGSSKNVNAIWFCTTEFKLFKKEARRDIAQDGGDSLCKKQYKALYALCQSAEGTASVVLRQSAALCSSRHRGLETMLFPKNVLCGQAIRGVLDRQAQWRADYQQHQVTVASNANHDSSCSATSTLSREQVVTMEEELAAFSRSKTLAARRMARVLAAGDEYVAREGAPPAVWDDVDDAVPLQLVEI